MGLKTFEQSFRDHYGNSSNRAGPSDPWLKKVKRARRCGGLKLRVKESEIGMGKLPHSKQHITNNVARPEKQDNVLIQPQDADEHSTMSYLSLFRYCLMTQMKFNTAIDYQRP